MIQIKNNKVYLNEEDYKALNGIWGAFRGYPAYCATLLRCGVENRDKLKEEAAGCYLAEVDYEIDVTDYNKIFEFVFNDRNYEIQ